MFESMQSNTNSITNINNINYGLTSLNSASQRFNATNHSNPQDKSEINSNHLDINELSGTTQINFNLTNHNICNNDNIFKNNAGKTSELRDKICKAKNKLSTVANPGQSNN